MEKRDGVSLQEAVSFTWNEIRTTSPADEVEILMETTDRYQDMTMDSIIEGQRWSFSPWKFSKNSIISHLKP